MQLAKAKSAVTRTVAKIKAAFGKMATSFKTAFDKIVRYAKYGALAITGALILATRAAMKQEQAYAKLAVVLKSTGHAARLSAKQLIAHAESLQKVTIYGDETIQSMQALLLTFKGIKGETFERTVEAILNVSTAMGQDLQQSAIQVGKAINDPILGMTALSRVGIQFTESQKEQIRALVESNRLFEAQTIILAELESEFGGMSRIIDTASGKWDQMRNALGDVIEVIGNALLPGVKDSLTAIKEWAEKNQERVGEWAKISVAYIAYVKDVLWTFILFMKDDWKTGISYGLKVSLELFKGFASSVFTVLSDLAESVGRMMAIKFRKILGPEISKRLGLAEPLTIAQMEERHIAPLSTRLKYIAGETAEKISEIAAPPEVIVSFSEAGEKLKATLESIGQTAEKVKEPMEEALVEPFEKAEEAAEEVAKVITRTLTWMESKTIEFSNAFRNAIEYGFERSMRDADNWKEHMLNMFEEIYWAAIRVAFIRPVAQGLGSILSSGVTALLGGLGGGEGPGTPPGGWGALRAKASLQYGGTVTQTGWAKVHKGETYSGVEGDKLEVNITYKGDERPRVRETAFNPKRQILSIVMDAAEHEPRFRRSIANVVRP